MKTSELKSAKMKILLTIFAFILTSLAHYAQSNNFVRASGTRILDPNGDNLIFRGIGTGNWFLQEGYMMGTGNATNGTQWHFTQKMINTFGENKTNEFFNAWWDKHFRKIDVDSMAAWGYNSVRVAMHYKMFTLPIEREPIAGEDTWFESGFARIDSLLNWCIANKMYLILDMHGCPGGQGSDSNISDYDASKPSLWESDENKRKLVSLWRRLAQRYATSQWIGGYDIINEPKWDALKANNNKDLWDLQQRIVQSIREVDNNHLIFLAGNDYGNNYTGLPNISTWGGNIALSFHKYWTYNNESSINWIINLGIQHNVPVWLGETGENSNTWFTDLIRLCESRNVGWSWWPVKKMGLNNILRSSRNADYDYLLNAWRNNTAVDVNRAFNGVMKFAEDHKFENCSIQYDVIDAMIRRPHTNEVKQFRNNRIDTEIFAVDYDFGPINYAYYDKNDATYQGSGEAFTRWNQGREYRNDGVDIQTCSDVITNGYAVGWIEDSEWLNYTLKNVTEGIYSIDFRFSAQYSGSSVYIEINGKRATKSILLPSTGGSNNWQTRTFTNIIFPSGKVNLKIVFEKGGCNFNYFKIYSNGLNSEAAFELLNAETNNMLDFIVVDFNQKIDQIQTNSLTIKADNTIVDVIDIKIDSNNAQRAIININKQILSNTIITIDNNSETCTSGQKKLVKFNNFKVVNKVAPHVTIPSRIEAENFVTNNGFIFQTCTDVGGGLNAGYTHIGDYLEYIVLAEDEALYNIDLRVSVNSNSARLGLFNSYYNNEQLNVVTLQRTGGWQNWTTIRTNANLRKGKNIIRLQAQTDGFNFNWFEISKIPETSTKSTTVYPLFKIIKTEVPQKFIIQSYELSNSSIIIFNELGRIVYTTTIKHNEKKHIDCSSFTKGVYIIKLSSNQNTYTNKIII